MNLNEILPKRFKAKLLKFIKRLLWPFYLRRFYVKIKNNEKIDKNLLKKLIFAWGNEGFSAKVDYLEACLNFTFKTNSHILECGSGLTTILMGFIAQKRGIKLITLEHNKFWAEKVKSIISKYNLDSVKIAEKSLTDFGDFEWYDLNNFTLHFDNFGLVICDGPPGNTKGGRYGLVPIMYKYFVQGTIILVDDTIREKEKQMISEWHKIINFDETNCNVQNPYSILEIK